MAEADSIKISTSVKHLPSVKIHSENLGLSFNVYIQDETSPSQQRCYIMTIHDIGTDHSSFQEFISCPEMLALKDRIIWLHVDLPGQEQHAFDLNISKYPSLPELASELVLVLDHFKIQSAVCLGEGLGANIAARFAMKHSNRCQGVGLIHPTGTTASFFDIFKEKINHLISPSNLMNPADEAYLIWHRYGHSDRNDKLVQAHIKEFQEKLYRNRNPKNVTLLLDAFLSRTNINEKLDDLKVDVFITVGKKASLETETVKFYRALAESRRHNRQLLVNCPLLEVDDVADVMGEAPDKLAIALQYFLQGIGLLPALAMERKVKGLGRLSRALSMEEADKPKLEQHHN